MDPTTAYKVGLGTSVHAATDGTVIGVSSKANEPGGNPESYHVLTQASPSSAYTLDYDYVQKPAVRAGDRVKAGDVLGIAEPFVAGSRFAFVEFSLIKYKGTSRSTDVCPTAYGSRQFNDLHQAALAANNAAFPASAMPTVCLQEHVP